jgi:hypothetical protein
MRYESLSRLGDLLRGHGFHYMSVLAEPRTTPGGQPWYSSLAILTALTLRAVFRLALRQAEGLIGSVMGSLQESALSVH